MLDYKRVFKTKESRAFVLHMLDWVPDEAMVRLQYRLKTGRRLDLEHPSRFTEKLCWYKLFYRDRLMSQCADKYEARDYVRSCGLERLLPECYGVFRSPDDIDFDALPGRFVLKDTLGGGNNEVVVCRDKEGLDIDSAMAAMTAWTRPGRHRKHAGREWVYDRDEGSRIIVEELLEPEPPVAELIDYKFFFMNGKSSYLYVLCDRMPGEGGQLGVFETSSFKQVPVWRADERRLSRVVPKPPNYSEMVAAAERLAAPFPEARVDLYDLGPEKGIRFGELTFFDGSGYFKYEPDEFDLVMGHLFRLPEGR